MVAMKSEAAEETIYLAENQSAGSDSHSVDAILWLFREAGTYDNSALTDTIAFSITMSHRLTIFCLPPLVFRSRQSPLLVVSGALLVRELVRDSQRRSSMQ